MSADTLLRKEKDGSFYKGAAEQAVGVEMQDGKKRILPEPEAKQKLQQTQQGVDELVRNINDYLLMGTPKMAAVYWQEKLAEHKDQISGGLADKKKPSEFDPEQLRMGVKVEREHAGDDTAKAREISMDHLTEHPKYYTALKKMEKSLEKKAAVQQWIDLPYTEGERSSQNVPVLGKRKRGDAPTADGSENYYASRTVATWQPPETAIPPKVASIGPLVTSSMDQLPDRGEDGSPIRLNTGRDALHVTHTSPNPRPLTEERTDATKVAHQVLLDFYLEKLASDPNLSEMEKEAILRHLQAAGRTAREMGRALVGAPVKLNVGGEAVELAGTRLLPKVPTYKSMGHSLEQFGQRMKGPAGMLPEEAKAMGFRTSAGARIAGEAAHSAGHHMGHATTTGKLLNPLGKPVGGAIEGLTRGVGQELERASGAVATGLGGAGRGSLGGGFTGALGRGLQVSAPRVGQAGELLAAAGTATGVGHALSPAAAGLSGVLKATGMYAPAKAALGTGGLNLAKDVAAAGIEHGVQRGAKVLPKALQALRGGAQVAA